MSREPAAQGAARYRTARAGSFTTRYLEAGEPEADAVVLLHDGGHGTDAQLCWGPVAELLASDFRVIAPDLLGWGGTDKAVFLDRGPYGFRIEHIGALLEVLGVERPAHFVGASLGGSLILRALAEAPGRWPMRSAVSIAGAGGPWKTGRFAELARYEASMEEARRVTELVVDDFDGIDEHVRRRYENSLRAGHWEAMMAPQLANPAGRGSVPADAYPGSLGTTDVPVLLIECARDVLLTSGWSAELASILPAGESLVLDCAHEPNIDRPEVVVEHLRAFFARNANAV